MKKRIIILTPKLAQRAQDSIFKEMTADEKIKMAGQFFELGKKLNALNDRKKYGNNGFFDKNS